MATELEGMEKFGRYHTNKRSMKNQGEKTMATKSSLEGMERFGRTWRASIKINLPADIPALFELAETNIDVVALAHRISKDLINSLKGNEFKVPSESLAELLTFIEELDDTFVLEHREKIGEMSKESLLGYSTGAEKELIYRLNELYDWGDYYRVNLSSHRNQGG